MVEEPFAFSSFVIVAFSSVGAVSSVTGFSPSIMTSSGTTVSLVCSLCVEQCLAATADASPVENEGSLGASSKFLLADAVVSAFLIVLARCDAGLTAKAGTNLGVDGVDLTALEAKEAARTRGMRYIARCDCDMKDTIWSTMAQRLLKLLQQ